MVAKHLPVSILTECELSYKFKIVFLSLPSERIILISLEMAKWNRVKLVLLPVYSISSNMSNYFGL